MGSQFARVRFERPARPGGVLVGGCAGSTWSGNYSKHVVGVSMSSRSEGGPWADANRRPAGGCADGLRDGLHSTYVVSAVLSTVLCSAAQHASNIQ